MSTAFYDLTIPVFVRVLENLSQVLAKGEAFATAQGIDPATLTEARLIADMGPLTAQIQRASDSAKGFPVRVGGIATVPMADEETSFADLQARIMKTIAFLQTVPRAAVDGKEDVPVVLETPSRSFTFTGRSYALEFVLPNLYFHVTTAYSILRMRGVPIGKMDFLGGI